MNGVNEMFCFSCHRLSAHAMLAHITFFIYKGIENFQKGNEIAELQLMQVSQQMDVFKKSLEEFAMKYKSEIKKNPEFRLA